MEREHIVTSYDEELAQLDEVNKLPAEYPGWMFERQGEYRRDLLNPAPRGSKDS